MHLNLGRIARVAAAAILACGALSSARAQSGPAVAIKWEAVNRFRLFAEAKDFKHQVDVWEALAPGERNMLGFEHALSRAARHDGWAADVGRLCFDARKNQFDANKGNCLRDGVSERYVNPIDHAVRLEAVLPPEFGPATCVWTFGDAAALPAQPCAEAVRHRFPGRKPVKVTLAVLPAAGAPASTQATVEVRDVLVVGMGDSIASGEGNPDRPVRLSDEGFCFERVGGGAGAQFYLPGRAVARLSHDCPPPPSNDLAAWNEARAGWMLAQCHRSLYSYQTRTALMLAIAQPHVLVTYLPLACSGATIANGLRGSQPATERPGLPGDAPPRDVTGQFAQLASLTGDGQVRRPDLLLLTIGANDMGFSGLVANAMVQGKAERELLALGKIISNTASAREKLKSVLAKNFGGLRASLRKAMGGTLARVVFVTYGDPAMRAQGEACPTSRRGFDAHPAFGLDGATAKATVAFVEDEFLPALEKLVACRPGGGCARPARDAMAYVESHRAAFAAHGLCAADAQTDPAFDTDCFRDGGSFKTGGQGGIVDPLVCRHPPGSFRAYASRARWVRTPNDSYFAAMTYADSLPWFLQASDIHSGLWGISGVVYGGAIHPTAEGHAAMADAALPEARRILALPPAP